MAGTLRETRDYSLFDLHVLNRDVKKIAMLEKSMKKHGWIDAYPMHVVRNGDKRMKIKGGHHRFFVAQVLGIPVKFVVCDDDSTIHELETSTVYWSLGDYLDSYVRAGRKPYIEVKEFHEQTGIGLGSCISLLAGETAGSNNKINIFKKGSYQTSASNTAGVVGDIITHMKKIGIEFATTELLVRAVSKIVWVDQFDPNHFKQKIGRFPQLVTKQPNLAAYVTMLDCLYNRGCQEKIPLVFLAAEAAKKRNVIKSGK